MPKLREVRAVHDRESIVVYQAYSAGIAEAALRAGRFVAPFSFGRMTWIKPSFLWLMHRSNWGHKAGQERILAVRVRRAAWDRALSLGVLTSPEAGVFRSPEEWAHAFSDAKVHVQWDPERSLRGAALPYYAIQVGVSRHLVREYAEEWILGIEDVTPLVRKVYQQIQTGHADKAPRLLPNEKVYPVDPAASRRLWMDP